MNTNNLRRFGVTIITIGLATTGTLLPLYASPNPNESPGSNANQPTGSEWQQQQGPKSAIETEGKRLNPQELQFFQTSANNNVTGIALGYLAIEKGASDSIKDLGRKMVDSNVQANKSLMNLASKEKVFIPINQVKPNEQEISQLSQATGAEFDKQFLKVAYSMDNQDKTELKQFLGKVSNPDLHNYAQNRLNDMNDRLGDLESKAGDVGLTAQDLRSLPPIGEAPGQQPPQPNRQNQ